jgi:hypothetical protein
MRWSDRDLSVDGVTLGNQEPNQTGQRFGVEVRLDHRQTADRVGGSLLLALGRSGVLLAHCAEGVPCRCHF